ncbi:hypothetical protein SNOG_09994 [Parastagonospora nodorum SN15]|uniref:Uncharacterized protein n=1 Tax=Phaeosphaeria nodorum (strain SN15 / ATCC MYA-4574 / FGSC 10173) TaxID=321614 RepID=Q0UE20_PHANO|nr:hypothetical protein SNOG_09994 [Parastagonospora nodorum SN15]EAT82329.2 hypothetical protein SNOG_09994 [Parastagonospora nodorum SN15]
MSDRYEWRGNGDISGPRATAGFAVSGRASEASMAFILIATGYTNAKLRIIEQEGVEATRDEDHKQRYAEKNARIEALKFEVEKIRHEDLQLQADTRRGEEKLAKMKSELKRLQPQQTKEQPPEFYMRPAKVKKGKKK